MFTKLIELLGKKSMRNIFTLMTGTTVAQAIPLLISPILTRLYTPEDFGDLAFFTTTVAIIAVLASGRFEHAIMLPLEEKEAYGILKLTIRISMIFNMVLLGIILLFAKDINAFIFKSSTIWWMYLLPIAAFLIILNQSLYFLNNRKQEYKMLSISKIAQSTGVSLTNLCAGFGGLSSGLIAGNVIGVFVSVGILFKSTKGKKYKIKALDGISVLSLIKKYKDFPKINMPHAFINTLSSSFPVFSLAYFFSGAATGFYSLGLRVVQLPLGIISASIQSVLYEKVVGLYNSGEPIYGYINSYVKNLVLVTIVPYVLFIVSAPYIFELLFGEQWRAAGVYIVILSPCLYIVFIASPLSFLPLMTNNQGKAFKIEVINTITKISGLIIGGMMNSISLSLLFFSLAGFFIVFYNLFWYLNIAKRHSGE